MRLSNSQFYVSNWNTVYRTFQNVYVIEKGCSGKTKKKDREERERKIERKIERKKERQKRHKIGPKNAIKKFRSLYQNLLHSNKYRRFFNVEATLQ